MRNQDRISKEIKVEKSAPYTYVAFGPIGASDSDSVWQVQRFDSTSGTRSKYAKNPTTGLATDEFIFSVSDFSALTF